MNEIVVKICVICNTEKLIESFLKKIPNKKRVILKGF